MDKGMLEAIGHQAVAEACISFTDTPENPDNTIDAISAGVSATLRLIEKWENTDYEVVTDYTGS